MRGIVGGVLVLAVVLLAGCVRMVWVHAEGLGEVRYRLDREACEGLAAEAARQAGVMGAPPPGVIVQDNSGAARGSVYGSVLTRCMKERGWELIMLSGELERPDNFDAPQDVNPPAGTSPGGVLLPRQ